MEWAVNGVQIRHPLELELTKILEFPLKICPEKTRTMNTAFQLFGQVEGQPVEDAVQNVDRILQC